MAVRTRTAFKATKNSRYTANTTGDISSGDGSDTFEDVADSMVMWEDDVLDEDDMASDSDTHVPTQQSLKAYVDAQVGGGVQTASITLSSAEILALNTTPKQIVAAPGSGKVIMVHNVFAFLTFVSSAYTTNVNLEIEYSGVSGLPCTILNFLSQTSSKWNHVLPNNFAASADIANNALVCSVFSGDPLAGDSTVKVIVTYSIVDVP